MRPIPEIQPVSNGLIIWQGYSPAHKTELSCAALLTAQGTLLIDPIRLTDAAFEELLTFGEIIAIILTNGNHERDTIHYQKKIKTPVYAHQNAETECPVDYRLQDNERVFNVLRVISLPGAGSGEIALYREDTHHLCLGDSLIHLESSGLAFLPDKYCLQPKQAKHSLLKLLDIPFQSCSFAHGLPLLQNPAERLHDLLEEKHILRKKS